MSGATRAAAAGDRPPLGRYALAAGLVRLGDELVPVALVLLALERTGRPAIAGALLAAYTLPALVSGPLLGAWLDRTPAARAALAGNAGVLALAMLGIVAGVGRAPEALPVALAALAGVTLPLTSAGFSSMVPRLVPVRWLGRANALDAATFNAAAVAGPALAGSLAAALGAARGALAVPVVAALGLAATLLLPLAPPEPRAAGDAARDSLLGAARAGLVQLVREPALRAATAASVLGYGCVGVLGVAFPLFARSLGAREAAAGWLWAALEAGALLGALLVARWPPRPAPVAVVIAGTALFAVAVASWPLARSLPVALVLVAVAGLLDGPVLPALFAVRQSAAPPGLLAQVSMTGVSLKVAAYAAGAALGGWLVPAIGARASLLAVAGGEAAAAALAAALLAAGSSRAAATPC